MDNSHYGVYGFLGKEERILMKDWLLYIGLTGLSLLIAAFVAAIVIIPIWLLLTFIGVIPMIVFAIPWVILTVGTYIFIMNRWSND